ncbi:MAG: metallophosphoesterase [Clostridia bacterium]|nr:metallophosphoesterase [Clostridia bacterium]
MAVYTLADLHLSFSTNKPMDVFGSQWENHAERLKEYWNYMVLNEDTVVVPGDISWAMSIDEAIEDFRFINNLNGKKIIMKGNHDYWWQSMKKLKEFTEKYSFDSISFLHNSATVAENIIVCGSRGWSCESSPSEQDRKIIAREALRFELSLKEAEKLNDGSREIVAFSHYPVLLPGDETSPILEVLVRHNVKRLYYGHLHGVRENQLIKRAGGVELELISADFRHFTPVRVN